MTLGLPEIIVISIIGLVGFVLPLGLAYSFGYNRGYRRGLESALARQSSATQH
jgi:hypothetical protein